MTKAEFEASLNENQPPSDCPQDLAALWWDARGEWGRAHELVDELTTDHGMAVHAYLHRKEGTDWNAAYWYNRAGRQFHRDQVQDEWQALVEGLTSKKSS